MSCGGDCYRDWQDQQDVLPRRQHHHAARATRSRRRPPQTVCDAGGGPDVCRHRPAELLRRRGGREVRRSAGPDDAVRGGLVPLHDAAGRSTSTAGSSPSSGSPPSARRCVSCNAQAPRVLAIRLRHRRPVERHRHGGAEPRRAAAARPRGAAPAGDVAADRGDAPDQLSRHRRGRSPTPRAAAAIGSCRATRRSFPPTTSRSGDLWLLKYHANEIDDGHGLGDCPVDFGPWLNGESLSGDVVVWYRTGCAPPRRRPRRLPPRSARRSYRRRLVPVGAAAGHGSPRNICSRGS